MTKSLKTVVMPDGSTTQILTSKPFTHAVVFYNPFYDGWTVKRWEESWTKACETHEKFRTKNIKDLGVKDFYSLPSTRQDEISNKFNDNCEILELNIHQPFDW